MRPLEPEMIILVITGLSVSYTFRLLVLLQFLLVNQPLRLFCGRPQCRR
jgi:hypothetical protein